MYILHMNKILNKIKFRNALSKPLIRIQISREAIISNYLSFKSATHLQIAPVLKSNAYGHGLLQIAEILKKVEVPFLVVDSFYEAKMLRRNSVLRPVLVIGFSTLEQIAIDLSDTSYTITSLEMLKEIADNLKIKRKFHLKIDTGMRRQGILPDEINQAVHLIGLNKNIRIDGVCSHFADADGEDKNFTLKQINEWNQAVLLLKQRVEGIRYFHISASAGAFYSKKIQANVLRLGIGLYGVNPSHHLKIKLKPAMRMDSVVTMLKKLKAREAIGYNLTYRSSKEKQIAVIPVGYYEGLDRRLSNRGSVIIKGSQCPIIGRVCMNICMVDVDCLPDVGAGDNTTIISDNPKDSNSIEKLAKLCETNPHELLVHIPGHLKREIV